MPFLGPSSRWRAASTVTPEAGGCDTPGGGSELLVTAKDPLGDLDYVDLDLLGFSLSCRICCFVILGVEVTSLHPP